MHILVYVAPDGGLNAVVAKTMKQLMEWHADHPFDQWRMYDADRKQGGWEAESPDAWKVIDRVPATARVLL